MPLSEDQRRELRSRVRQVQQRQERQRQAQDPVLNPETNEYEMQPYRERQPSLVDDVGFADEATGEIDRDQVRERVGDMFQEADREERSIGETIRRSPGWMAQGALGTVSSALAGASRFIDEDAPAYDAFQTGAENLESAAGYFQPEGRDPYQESWERDLISGLGSIGTYAGIGALSGGVGAGLGGALGLGARGVGLMRRGAQSVGAMTPAAYQGAEEAATRAEEAGADPEAVQLAAQLGLGAGAVQVLSVPAVILRRLPPNGRAAYQQWLKRAGEAFGVEFLAENAGAVGQNMIDQYVHTPETDTFQDVPYRGTVSGGAAAVLATALFPFQRRAANLRTPQETGEGSDPDADILDLDQPIGPEGGGPATETPQSLSYQEGGVPVSAAPSQTPVQAGATTQAAPGADITGPAFSGEMGGLGSVPTRATDAGQGRLSPVYDDQGTQEGWMDNETGEIVSSPDAVAQAADTPDADIPAPVAAEPARTPEPIDPVQTPATPEAPIPGQQRGVVDQGRDLGVSTIGRADDDISRDIATIDEASQAGVRVDGRDVEDIQRDLTAIRQGQDDQVDRQRMDDIVQPGEEIDLSAVLSMPRTMETVTRLMDQANAAAPQGYNFSLQDGDIWLSGPNGDLRASRDIDINISPAGILNDLQRAIDTATEDSDRNFSARTVRMPDDVDPSLVQAERERMFNDPANWDMTPEEQIVEAVRRVRKGSGSDAETAPQGMDDPPPPVDAIPAPTATEAPSQPTISRDQIRDVAGQFGVRMSDAEADDAISRYQEGQDAQDVFDDWIDQEARRALNEAAEESGDAGYIENIPFEEAPAQADAEGFAEGGRGQPDQPGGAGTLGQGAEGDAPEGQAVETGDTSAADVSAAPQGEGTAEGQASEGSPEWARNAYDRFEVPDGWYVHGRSGRDDLSEYMAQATRDWSTAEQYSGTDGSMWMMRPSSAESVLDFSSQDTEDMDRVVSRAVEDYEQGRLPFEDDIAGSIGKDIDDLTTEDIETAVREGFSPENIVDSAGAFDGPAWAEWLGDRFSPSFAMTPDGGVALDTSDIISVRVPDQAEPQQAETTEPEPAEPEVEAETQDTTVEATPEPAAQQKPTAEAGDTGTPAAEAQPESDQQTDAAPSEQSSPEIEGGFGTSEDPSVPAIAQIVRENMLAADGADISTMPKVRAWLREQTGLNVASEGTVAKKIDEAIEFGVTLAARDMYAGSVADGAEPGAVYQNLVSLYERMPNLTVRTSNSASRQAYSTPPPIAYIAARQAGIDNDTTVYDPSAGNGMLLMTAATNRSVVNELDGARASNLRETGFTNVSQFDAMVGQPDGVIDAVITNPPFGKVKGAAGRNTTWTVDGLKTKEIDHAMALHALQNLPDNGRAVLILGSKKAKGKNPEAERKKQYSSMASMGFYSTLFRRYNVTDMYTIDGKLYGRMGAQWPIDVIVIDGRRNGAQGDFSRPLPAVELPRVYTSFDQLNELATGDPDATNQSVGEGVQISFRPGSGKIGESVNSVSDADADGDVPGVRTGADAAPRNDDTEFRSGQRVGGPGGKGGGTRGDVAPGREPGDVGGDTVGEQRDGPRPDAVGSDRAEMADEGADQSGPEAVGTDTVDVDAADGGGTAARDRTRVKAPAQVETATQTTYAPRSKSNSVGTLTPTALKGPIERALADLEANVGDIDQYVADKVGFRIDQLRPKDGSQPILSAEQVDAVALAVAQVERGSSFIIGDQTGVGKGRFVASMIKYAHRQGLVPVFMTMKPGLYGDMVRDLSDIGHANDVAELTTNTNLRGSSAIDTGFPDADGNPRKVQSLVKKQYDEAMAHIQRTGTMPDGQNALFTTYDQMNTKKGEKAARHYAMEAIAPNAMFILDESHNAAGQPVSERQSEDDNSLPRSQLIRELLAASGRVIYSSATYAKNPHAMTLYSQTDIGKVEADPTVLSETIRRGGVPLQQVLAEMISEAGQYTRREKSFDGINFTAQMADVSEAISNANSEMIARMFRADLSLADYRDTIAESMLAQGMVRGVDPGVAMEAADSNTFASTIHNIVGQMFLSMKSNDVAYRAIEAIERGEAPVVTVANTFGAILDQYVTEAGIETGGDVSGISFGSVLERYLDRIRRISFKDPANDDKRIHVHISDKMLIDAGAGDIAKQFGEIRKAIRADKNIQDMPGSPIDAIRRRINEAGYSAGELTGRNLFISNNDTLEQRDNSDSQKAQLIRSFNAGKTDALIINRAVATGYSMHASERNPEAGQKKRLMILAQPEANVDNFMQILGRVNRQGQIVKPEYAMIVSSDPAERRTVAQIMKKLASLNANTTGGRKSAIDVDAVDIMNIYGDRIAAQFIEENPQIGRKVDLQKPSSQQLPGFASKLTGRSVLLTPKERKYLWDTLEARYTDLIEGLNATGQNVLEATTLPLEARTVERSVFVEANPDVANGPFAEPAYMEKVNVKALGKPMTVEETTAEIEKSEYSEAKKDVWLKSAETVMRDRIKDADDRITTLEKAAAADGVSPSKKQDINKKISNANEDKANARSALEQITNKLSMYTPGDYYSITSHGIDENGDTVDGGESVNARLLDIRRSGDDAGALAPSNYNLVFGLASGARRMNISLSGVMGGDVSINTSRAPMYEADVTEFFRSGREDRWMVTGNVFAGFNEMGGKGQVTRFTDENGGVRAGILMKRGFDPVASAKERPVRFTSQEAQRFLEMVPRAQIKSRDGFVKIGYDNVRYAELGRESKFLVTIERKAGAAVKNAEQIRRHTVEGQFSTRRGKPWTAKVEPHKLQDFLDAMRDTADVVFQTDSHKDEANTVVGQSPSAEAGQPQYQRPYMSVPRKPVYRSRATDRYTPKRSFMQDRGRIAGRVKDIGRRIFGDGLNIQTVDRLYDGSGREVFGVYYSQGIPGGAVEHIAAIAVDKKNVDPIATMGHEGFHYLEQMGAFSDAEMSVLRRKARQWLRTFKTAQRYPKREDHTRDQYNAMLQREAMADAYGEYLSGHDQGEAQSIFDKIHDFIERLGNWLRGNGYQSARDIFDAIGHGDYAFTSADGSIVQAMYQRGDQTPGRKGGVNHIAEQVSSRVERTPENAQRAVKNARNWLKDTYDPNNRLPNTRQIGWFAKLFAHPATIASMFKRFAPVYESVQKQFERREQLTQKYAELAGRYLTGANATREKVNKALAAGRLQKRELPDSALRMDFGLDGEGVAMYRSVRQMLDAALDDFKNVIYVTYGIDTSDGSRPTAQELRDMAESETGKRAKELEAAAEKIDEIDRSSREGYVPFSRYGQIGIAVRQKQEDGETEVIHYEMVETDLSRGPLGRTAGRRINQAKVKEVRDRLVKRYANMPNVEVTEPFEVREAPPDINEVSLGMVDQLAKIGGADSSDYAEVRDALDNAIQKANFRRHWIRSRDVAGYSMDFQRVIADYINGISTYIARHETRPDIEKSYGEIDISKQRSLSQYAREYIEYAQTPQEEFQNFRHATFFMYLAGNISSAVVNLSQVPVVTVSYLMMFTNNPAQVSREFIRAYKEVAAMVSWQKGSLFPSFDLTKAPSDVVDDLIRTDHDGLLNPQVSHEMVGLAAGQRRFLREQRQSVGNVADKFIALYSAAERVNRIVTFIAVHRLGRDQKIMDKAKRVLSSNELVALRIREGEFGPTELARQTIEDTHFRQGKGNRQVISRGLGAPMLQFMSFITNALELQYKMASQHGIEGMKGLGMMAGMLILTTGIYGLPFGDDMKDMIERLVSWARSRDLDIEQSVYDAFEEMGVPGATAEILQRGLLRQLGIDVSRRIGMGSIVPAVTNPLDAFIPFDMTYGRATRMMDHMKQDRYLEATGELLPLFMKNPILAATWSQDGVRTRYGSTAIPAQDLSTGDLFAKALGFNPTSVARGRELLWAQTRAQTAADQYRQNFYTRFSSAVTDRVKARQNGNESAANSADDDISQLLGELQAYNESVTPSEMIILSTPGAKRAIDRRVRQNIVGQEDARRVRRQARERFSEIAQTRSNLGLLSGIVADDLSDDARDAYGTMSQGQAPAAVRVLEQLTSG